MTGANSIGAQVGNNALISLVNSSITALAAGSIGASVGGGVDPSEFVLRNSQITATTGLMSEGDITLGMTAQFSASIDSSNITSTSGDALLVDNAIGAFQVSNGSVIQAGNGVALRAINSVSDLLFDLQTNVDLNIERSQVIGDVITDFNLRGSTYGSIAHVNLTDQALLRGKAEYASSINIDPSSRWEITGLSDVMALNNQGVAAFSAPTAGDFKTLTVHGNYQGTNGLFILNTQLGDDSSPTDRLIITGDSSGGSNLQINNANGAGAQTDNGIQVVQVGGDSAGLFRLTNRVIAGIYEYDLYHGNDGNWYLRSIGQPDPGPGPAPDPQPRIVQPEHSVYLHNQTIASTMFMHTLHDRLGEPQYTDTYQGPGNAPAVWVRITGAQTDSRVDNGRFDLDTDTTLVQVGGDIARWTNNGSDRWHFGLMAGYGHSESDSDPREHQYLNNGGIRRTASGKIDGYSIGAYTTWYGNRDKPTGPYVDVWGQYAWYNNEVQGNGAKEESYDSSGWTISLESGYAFIAGDSNTRHWMIEPQAQIAYNSYCADDLTDEHGVRIRNGDADGIITRLGARVYTRSKLNENSIQPFIEVNWWYSNAKNSMQFNDSIAVDDMPDNRYELKAGLQGEIAKGWQLWGHIGGEWGNNSYQRYEGMLGVKHQF